MTKEKQSQSSMVKLGVPLEYPELLPVLGMLAISHGNLEMVQIMCLKVLKRLEPKKAIEEYRHKPASHVRKEIHKIIEGHVEGDEPINKAARRIKSLVDTARCVSEQRNDLIHCFWAMRDGSWVISSNETNWQQLPDVAVVKDLSLRILQLTSELNDERLSKEKAFQVFIEKRNT